MKLIVVTLALCLVSCSTEKLPARKARRVTFEYEQDQHGRMIITDEQFAGWLSTHCSIWQRNDGGHPITPGATTLRLYCQADPVGPTKDKF